MTTEQITVDYEDGWRSITCTGTVVHIASVTNERVRVRLGLMSTSEGFVMGPGDTLSANETVYVKAAKYNSAKPAVIVTVKD